MKEKKKERKKERKNHVSQPQIQKERKKFKMPT